MDTPPPLFFLHLFILPIWTFYSYAKVFSNMISISVQLVNKLCSEDNMLNNGSSVTDDCKNAKPV